MFQNENYLYSFNNQDYEMQVRLYNGVNDVYLSSFGWDDLYLEEDIFDWFVKGSIVINTPFESLERESDEAMEALGTDKEKIVYKFRNDGRDTLYLYIKPKSTDNDEIQIDFEDRKWLIELETVVYDVQDLPHTTIADKKKKLYFWEKTYQMMSEKDVSFSTAIVGENLEKQNQENASNEDRMLKTGDAIAELLRTDDTFVRHANLTFDKNFWNSGDEKNKIFFTSPFGYKFIDCLTYLVDAHTASSNEDHQPCLLKFERAEQAGTAKQFSLISLKDYFKKAGTSEPGEYQWEHFFIEEHSHQEKVPALKKAPLSSSQSREIKADQYNTITNYQLVDFSGKDFAQKMNNRYIGSYNSTDGQFNIETKNHTSEQYKNFYLDSINPYVMKHRSTTQERSVSTSYIVDGRSMAPHFSVRPKEAGRFSDGKNKLLKYFIFNNLGISFSVRGMTFRQPGRFFGVSRQTLNDKEFDHKLEGQYFVTNVVHHFSTTARNYTTMIMGVKTHSYKEETQFTPDDLILIP